MNTGNAVSSEVHMNANDYPCIDDIIESAERLHLPRTTKRGEARDRLVERLQAIRRMLPGLSVQRSRNFAALMEGRSVILDVEGIRDLARPLLFTAVTMVLRQILRPWADGTINRLEVIEEAHTLLGGHTDMRTADLKEASPSGVLRDLRKAGTSAVVVSQLISDVAPAVRANLGSIICLRQGHQRCVREALGALNLPLSYEEELSTLPNRCAIARFSRHGRAIYLALKDARGIIPQGPPMSREDARERSRPVLEQYPFVKRSGPVAGMAQPGSGDAARPAEGLSPREMKVFARIAERPWELVQDRIDALGLTREAEADARAKLEARGLLRPAGLVGAKCRLCELTPRGLEVARALRLSIAKLSKGGVCHECLVQYVQRSLGRHSSAFRFQRTGIAPTTGGVQPDLLLLLPSGGRVPIQVSVANQPAAEAAALLRLHRLALLGQEHPDKVDFVLAVAVSKHHRQALERALKRQNSGDAPGRIVLEDFDSVVSDKVDWARVLELPL